MIARIIDPKAWETRDRQLDHLTRVTGLSEEDHAMATDGANYYVRESLRKADAILAALPVQEVGEQYSPVACLAEPSLASPSLATEACEPNPGNWWVSWFGHSGTFELHTPWWVSGSGEHDGEEYDTICAAVSAASEEGVRRQIAAAHDSGHEPWFRFIEPKPDSWSPFSDRFPAAPWMRWAAPTEDVDATTPASVGEDETASEVEGG